LPSRSVVTAVVDFKAMEKRIRLQAAADLERALQQGVVPVQAQGLVGSNALPGDFGFDPLHLAEKDYFKMVQNFLLSLIPARRDVRGDGDDDPPMAISTTTPRPQALILRDYREAEIRHSRLAMLAAIFWPLQELLDQFVLDDEYDNTININHALLWNPPVTLPYFPLFMTAIMLLLGYLDIYSQAIKDMDRMGEAFV
jgi:Chlorophyll A-B binding protein